MSDVKLNHLAVVVEDIEQAATFWRDGLGLPMGEAKEVTQEAVKIAFFESGESHIELVQPVTQDSGIAKYLAKKGAGMHHVCFEVPDIEATMKKLVELGVHLINETPRERDGWRYIFIHPKSTGGVLVELYQVIQDAS